MIIILYFFIKHGQNVISFLCEISKVIKLGRELICYFQELISYALIYYMFYIIYDITTTKKKVLKEKLSYHLVFDIGI